MLWLNLPGIFCYLNYIPKRLIKKKKTLKIYKYIFRVDFKQLVELLTKTNSYLSKLSSC